METYNFEPYQEKNIFAKHMFKDGRYTSKVFKRSPKQLLQKYSLKGQAERIPIWFP